VKGKSRTAPGGRSWRGIIIGILLAAIVLVLLVVATAWPAGSSARASNGQDGGSKQSTATASVSTVPAFTRASAAVQRPFTPVSSQPAAPAPKSEATTRPQPSATPTPEPTVAAPLIEVVFTLRTVFEGGRMLFVGEGGDIDSVVSPDLIVAPGTRVQMVLVNGDGISHDITFPDFGAQSGKVSRRGKSVEIVFTVPAEQGAGAYVYYCTLPGHREAGQKGWLMVEEG
jgi:plastocyanin